MPIIPHFLVARDPNELGVIKKVVDSVNVGTRSMWLKKSNQDS